MKEAQLPSQGSMADIGRKHNDHAWPALEGCTSAIKQKHDHNHNEARQTLKQSRVTIGPVVFELCLDAAFCFMKAISDLFFLDAYSCFFVSNSSVLSQTIAPS